MAPASTCCTRVYTSFYGYNMSYSPLKPLLLKVWSTAQDHQHLPEIARNVESHALTPAY